MAFTILRHCHQGLGFRVRVWGLGFGFRATEAKFFDDIFGKPVVKDVVFVRDTSSLIPLIEACP